jgi:hypothetical protein
MPDYYKIATQVHIFPTAKRANLRATACKNQESQVK